MSRWIHTILMTGAVAALGALTSVTALAADKPEPPAQPSAPQGREAGETDPARRIDKAIAAYESRADQELDQIRKDVTRLRKELSELGDLQIDLTLSLAELQAEIRVLATPRSAAGGDDSSPGSSATPTSSTQERQRLRCLELARELRQVQETLRTLVQQKRNETDQVIIQLRNLRTQQRQMTTEAAQNAQAAKPSQDE